MIFYISDVPKTVTQNEVIQWNNVFMDLLNTVNKTHQITSTNYLVYFLQNFYYHYQNKDNSTEGMLFV